MKAVFSGFKLAKNFREKGLLPPEILGRSLLILERRESVITLITLDGVNGLSIQRYVYRKITF